MSGQRHSYDQIAYPSQPQHRIHPDHIASLALLHGQPFTPVAQARVLEIACGNGTHLIPIAAAFPQARFVGLDIAEGAIARAASDARDCGLENIEFHVADILDTPLPGSGYDYILCHGLYSWVEEPVREALLARIAGALGPRGIALVSYNALPGWSLHQPTRDILLWHLREIADPAERLDEARAFAGYLARAISESSPSGLALRSHFEEVARKHPAYLWHDELSPAHRAFYLHEFAAAAARHGLGYLADSEPVEHLLTLVPREASAPLHAVASNRLELEQYADFLFPRRFRHSLLVRGPAPGSSPDPRRLVSASFSANPAPMTWQEVAGKPGRIRFQLEGGPALSTDLPFGAAALIHLARSVPARTPFAELARIAGLAPDEDPAPLLQFLFESGAGGFTQFHTAIPHTASEPGDHPVLFAPARLAASRGPDVPTPHHRVVHLDQEWVRQLVSLADGSRSLAQLRARLTCPDPDRSPSRPPTPAEFDEALKRLGRLGLVLR